MRSSPPLIYQLEEFALRKEEKANEKGTEPEKPEKPGEGFQTEGPIWRKKPVLRAFYPFYLVGALALGCTAVAELSLPLPLWTVGLLVPLSFFVIALPFALRLAWTFTLTGKEAKSEFRLWVGRSRNAPLDKVTDVVAEQGPIARLLGFGSIRMDTAGTPFPGVKFWGIDNPFQIEKKAREAVDDARDDEG
ncbi:hypothetical protein AKJ41_00760 [candidate division MSBL1 archaeon SCGC-AAA259O05]|uniref:YdbS-like PH domain-containing protein n=1 Tax=candidate division MSBL1 archaeon SCGC-AAA259O05 TaxID=1698271 RepID=A0A133V5H7_9EURY|nr:hypothetical protein AKJ41_00760 [candidate division MSBL1 archaeon SCGC-AAA259O05]